MALYYPGTEKTQQMTQTRTFRGGVWPPLTSELSRMQPITNAAVPPRAVISMRQYAGAPAQCLVRPGDPVREGMVIGKAPGPEAIPVHASIPGRVAQIIDAPDGSGGTCPAVIIDLEGEFDRSGRGSRLRQWEQLSRSDLLAAVQSAGIVDMGSRAVPAHMKLDPRAGADPVLLVANGVEDDPSLSCVFGLLRDRTRELVEGIRIAMRIVGKARAVLAVGEADRGLIPAFERAIDASADEVGIAVVSSRYPQAHEGLLAAALGGWQSPGESDPGAGRGHSAGGRTVVLSVATLLAVREAVCLDRPFIERVVTVSGSLVRSPRNLKARIGTRIGDLVEECGGCVEAPAAFILGGLMTGRMVESPDVPLTKSVGGVIALSAREARGPRARPCIGCGSCIDVCPWGLEPSRLCKLLEHGRVDQALAEGLADCSLCGCCAFVCPSSIALAGVLAARPGRVQ